ncbi:MAG: DUF1295 domain-containing protein, partial [Proteobacteria bacterium]|nr:DUF1295 domain-containing protein [Pseudomonadota bacterium]
MLGILPDASIIDIFWGPGFVLLTWLYFLLADGYDGRSILISILVTIWGLRLSLHLARRNWGQPEDRRYQRMRERAGSRFWWRSYITVFLLQGAPLWTLS